MIIFPAIDLYDKKAVRLFQGDYNQMTVYSDNPIEIAKEFAKKGATHIHLVDLEGAKEGTTPNCDIICRIKEETGLFCEAGGGIRTMDTIERYVSANINRIVLGTAAVKDEGFVKAAIEKYGERIAVGVDIKDGLVAIKGWTEKSDLDAFAFCKMMENIGVKTLICTDISKDGAMNGTNLDLYKALSEEFEINIVASGGISSLEDVKKLRQMNIYGGIIGRAYYTGAIDLTEAVEVAK